MNLLPEGPVLQLLTLKQRKLCYSFFEPPYLLYFFFSGLFAAGFKPGLQPTLKAFSKVLFLGRAKTFISPLFTGWPLGWLFF